MKVIKSNDEFGLCITIIEEDKNIIFNYGGTGDLYWSINKNNNSDKETFLITKENYFLYTLFDELFFDIENINIFDEDYKTKCKLYNYSNYNELFCNKTITWYSDESVHDDANVLKIIKENEIFRLVFYIQQKDSGCNDIFHSSRRISIRFCNSGSRYKPFNILFMKMYNSMNRIDDVNDFGHQIHVEEYLYNKKKIKK